MVMISEKKKKNEAFLLLSSAEAPAVTCHAVTNVKCVALDDAFRGFSSSLCFYQALLFRYGNICLIWPEAPLQLVCIILGGHKPKARRSGAASDSHMFNDTNP